MRLAPWPGLLSVALDLSRVLGLQSVGSHTCAADRVSALVGEARIVSEEWNGWYHLHWRMKVGVCDQPKY